MFIDGESRDGCDHFNSSYQKQAIVMTLTAHAQIVFLPKTKETFDSRKKTIVTADWLYLNTYYNLYILYRFEVLLIYCRICRKCSKRPRSPLNECVHFTVLCELQALTSLTWLFLKNSNKPQWMNSQCVINQIPMVQAILNKAAQEVIYTFHVRV